MDIPMFRPGEWVTFGFHTEFEQYRFRESFTVKRAYPGKKTWLYDLDGTHGCFTGIKDVAEGELIFTEEAQTLINLLVDRNGTAVASKYLRKFSIGNIVLMYRRPQDFYQVKDWLDPTDGDGPFSRYAIRKVSYEYHDKTWIEMAETNVTAIDEELRFIEDGTSTHPRNIRRLAVLVSSSYSGIPLREYACARRLNIELERSTVAAEALRIFKEGGVDRLEQDKNLKQLIDSSSGPHRDYTEDLRNPSIDSCLGHLAEADRKRRYRLERLQKPDEEDSSSEAWAQDTRDDMKLAMGNVRKRLRFDYEHPEEVE